MTDPKLFVEAVRLPIWLLVLFKLCWILFRFVLMIVVEELMDWTICAAAEILCLYSS